jgi:hypothetical protein
MADKPWHDKSWDELRADTNQGIGPGSANAALEAQRRLINSIETASRSADRYASRMLWLTIILVVLTIVLTVLTIVLVADATKDWRPEIAEVIEGWR